MRLLTFATIAALGVASAAAAQAPVTSHVATTTKAAPATSSTTMTKGTTPAAARLRG